MSGEQQGPQATNRQWVVNRQFVLTQGELNREAESHLTKKMIRIVGFGQNGEQAYLQYSKIEAASAWEAAEDSNAALEELLMPYGVEFMVYELLVRALRPGE